MLKSLKNFIVFNCAHLGQVVVSGYGVNFESEFALTEMSHFLDDGDGNPSVVHGEVSRTLVCCSGSECIVFPPGGEGRSGQLAEAMDRVFDIRVFWRIGKRQDDMCLLIEGTLRSYS